MAFLFMYKHQERFPIRKMAKVFEVSVSGYYAWRARKPGKRFKSDSALVERIKVIQKRHKGRYGSPRMHEDLRDENVRTSRKRVARLMRQHGLSAKSKKKWITTTDSRHDLPIAENILNREFSATAPGTKWVSDITYLRTTQGWLYLCVIIDLWDRKVIGWSLATDMGAIHVVRALAMASMNRKPQQGLTFHSDRGIQYCSKEFRAALSKECPTVRQSMSRKGNCWDNACAETFFKTLKRELDAVKGRSTRKQAQLAVFEYIEAYYNRIRRHSALGYSTPVSFGKTAA
jgi:transposase InsO family protein